MLFTILIYFVTSNYLIMSDMNSIVHYRVDLSHKIYMRIKFHIQIILPGFEVYSLFCNTSRSWWKRCDIHSYLYKYVYRDRQKNPASFSGPH